MELGGAGTRQPVDCIAVREAQWAPHGWTGTSSHGRRGRLYPSTKPGHSSDPSNPLTGALSPTPAAPLDILQA